MRNSLTKPLRGGNPEIAAAPTRNVAPVHGMRLQQPAEVVEVAGPGRVRDRAGPEEEEALEQRVVEHVEEGAGEARQGDQRQPGVDPEQRRPRGRA